MRDRVRRSTAVIGFVLLAIGGIVDHVLIEDTRRASDRRAAEARIVLCAYVNDHALQPIKGVLELAETSAARNPLPPGMPDDQRRYYEEQRARAAAFYAEAKRLATPVPCRELLRGHD